MQRVGKKRTGKTSFFFIAGKWHSRYNKEISIHKSKTQKGGNKYGNHQSCAEIAAGGALADQWLEVIEPDDMGEHTVFTLTALWFVPEISGGKITKERRTFDYQWVSG